MIDPCWQVKLNKSPANRQLVTSLHSTLLSLFFQDGGFRMGDGAQFFEFYFIQPECVSRAFFRTFRIIEHAFFFSKLGGIRYRNEILLPVGIDLHTVQGGYVLVFPKVISKPNDINGCRLCRPCPECQGGVTRQVTAYRCKKGPSCIRALRIAGIGHFKTHGLRTGVSDLTVHIKSCGFCPCKNSIFETCTEIVNKHLSCCGKFGRLKFIYIPRTTNCQEQDHECKGLKDMNSIFFTCDHHLPLLFS